MTTTITHPSGLPEQEPTSPTAVVLCGDESWAKTGADWESPRELCSWGDLRTFAAERGGATLYDLADLPTGLTGVQKEVVRSIESKFLARGRISTDIRNAFPEAFGDPVTATWKSGDSDDVWADLLRVARMDGASIMATQSGVTYSGLVHAVHGDRISIGCTSIGAPALTIPLWGVDWTITVTAPKPADPTGGDPVVLARASNPDYKRVYFLAEDGTWSSVRGSFTGMWPTGRLYDIERLSAQTIAELMGGAS